MLVTKEKITTADGTKDEKKQVNSKLWWKAGMVLMLHLKYYIEQEHLFS